MKIVLKARLKCQAIDAEDTTKARTEYEGKSPGFDEVFVYRKGSKVVVYKGSLQIARKYRELQGKFQPWDLD